MQTDALGGGLKDLARPHIEAARPPKEDPRLAGKEGEGDRTREAGWRKTDTDNQKRIIVR